MASVVKTKLLVMLPLAVGCNKSRRGYWFCAVGHEQTFCIVCYMCHGFIGYNTACRILFNSKLLSWRFIIMCVT